MTAIHIKRPPALVFRAGRDALAQIRRQGFVPQDVRLVPGAAGGPKALGLHGLDCAIFGEWLPRAPRERWLAGASVGAWRFSALAQPDPIAALKRFTELYVGQHYSLKPTLEEITSKCEAMVDAMLDGHAQAIVDNPQWRLAIFAVRSKGWLADEGARLGSGLAAVATRNALSRQSLGKYFDRVVLHSPGKVPPFLPLQDFPTEAVPLSGDNLRPALLASGAIPMVIRGVTVLPGAGPGVYRDGGLLDYHFDLPFSKHKGIVLYPHFIDRIVPGWFDKSLPWRKPDPAHVSNVLLVAPSRDYVASLPLGKIPDRNDFRQFAGRDAERMRYWHQAIGESERLGDEFLQLVESGELVARLQPL